MPSGTPMLEIEGLHVKYGGIHALKGISVNVEEMRIVTLLGSERSRQDHYNQSSVRNGSDNGR